MSRKHFRALAKAISYLQNENERKNMSELIGKVCSSSNPCFDWIRWNEACGVKS